MTLNELHDWSRTQDPEVYECENCGTRCTIDEGRFTEPCPKS